ncbi:NSUN2 [Symbiodinium natans]|uniref:NSUN2 protein n=1 Tax=Symbiodinium natans TaxID=878477 RepID=A0A812UM53_9DINO|nr:NSUN2 [Symbiodinium natans]
MWSLLGLYFICAARAATAPSASCEEASGTCWKSATLAEEVRETGLSMVQRGRVRQRAKKPWETLRFTAVAYHKSGVFLMQELQNFIFGVLGAPDSAIGKWQQPCFNEIIYNEEWCKHHDAPIRTLVDIYGPDLDKLERAAAGPNGMRVAGSVRDPLAMVASAYCYHHRGEELGYPALWPPGAVITMGPEEGVKFVAERMFTTVQNMTEIFANPAEDTIRLSFEKFANSSESFDHEAARLVDFWLGDFVSDFERSQMLESAKQADLHRNADELKNKSQAISTHSNSEDCEVKALEATKRLPPELLAQYRTFQTRLGYKAD